MSSSDGRRIRNSVSDLSTYVAASQAPWVETQGTQLGYPGSGPSFPQSPLEAFDKFLASRQPKIFPEIRSDVIETMIDYVTPGFHEIVEKGEFRPINPMSKTVVLDKPYAVTDISIKQLSVPRGNPHNNILTSDGLTYCGRYSREVSSPGKLASSEDINALLLEAKASLKSSGMDYLTTAAEFRETLGMFLSMKQNLLNRRDGAVKAWSRDLASKRRSGKFSGFHSLKEGWEAFSNFWLEYRFGWRILAYDIQAINDYYKRKNDGTLLFTRRSEETFTDNSSIVIDTRTTNTCFLEVRGYLESTETVRVGYSAFIDQSVLGNPILLNTAYDITPWTLVVDMFFNVQNNIIALSSMPIGVSEVPDSGFVSRKSTNTLTILPTVIPRVGLDVDERLISVLTPGINKSYTRERIGEPSFDISFQPNLDFGKIIDLATLALPIFRIIRKSLK